MSKISVLETNEVAMEKPVRELSRNEAAKIRMAAELLHQGLSEESICRILHISPDYIS